MRPTVGLGLALLVACSGDSSDDVPTVAACDSLQTTVIGEVPVEEWPAGLATARDFTQDIAGFYQAFDSCTGEKVQITIESIETTQVEIVTTPYTAGAPCGCTQDPDFAPDANLDMTTFIPRFSFRVDNVDDPFVSGFNFQMDGATYSPTEQLLLRACTTENIDPVSNSIYRDVDLVVRATQNQNIEAQLIFDPLDGSSEVVCTIDDFERIN